MKSFLGLRGWQNGCFGLKVKGSEVLQGQWWGLTLHLDIQAAALHNLPFASVWSPEFGKLWNRRDATGESRDYTTLLTLSSDRVLPTAKLILGFGKFLGRAWRDSGGWLCPGLKSACYSANAGTLPWEGETGRPSGGPRH